MTPSTPNGIRPSLAPARWATALPYVAALAGCRVRITDADAASLGARSSSKRAPAFDKAVEKGKCTAAQRDAALQRLLSARRRLADAVADATIVIEADSRAAGPQAATVRRARARGDARALLASNTSSLSITEIAAVLAHPGVRRHALLQPRARDEAASRSCAANATNDATVARARAFAEWLGKTPIVVRDTPGFATSRLGVVLGLEAIRMLEQGVASAPDIDRAMELGYNHPMGPLRLTDLVGLDVRLAIAEHLHARWGTTPIAPPDLLRRMVREGRVGQEDGRRILPVGEREMTEDGVVYEEARGRVGADHDQPSGEAQRAGPPGRAAFLDAMATAADDAQCARSSSRAPARRHSSPARTSASSRGARRWISGVS